MRRGTRFALVAVFGGTLGIGGLAVLPSAMAAAPGQAPATTIVVPAGTAEQARDGSCDGTPDPARSQLHDGSGGGTATVLADASCDGTPDPARSRLHDGSGGGVS